MGLVTVACGFIGNRVQTPVTCVGRGVIIHCTTGEACASFSMRLLLCLV